MENYLGRTIANQELTDATEESKKKTARFNELLREFRGYAKEFFFQISIVSAGILSLSVTFIGYISSKDGFQIAYLWVLFLGWFLEAIALIGGLYRNYVYNHFGHWQAQADLVKSRLKVEEATLNMAEKYPDSFVNIKSSEELDNFIKKTKKQIRIYKKNYKFNKEKEEFYEKLWLFVERTTIFGFGFGTILIIIFAATNLPI